MVCHHPGLSTFLFPNTFLTFGPNGTGGCCVVGFHSYDSEPADPNSGTIEKRYVLNYSSWVTPGLFGDSFSDVTALSHEVSESYSDPFVASETCITSSRGGCRRTGSARTTSRTAT